MSPKTSAACRFVEATGKRSIIGAMPELHQLIAGTAGTTISPNIATLLSVLHEC